jgi:RNA polymerase sigma-70 factor (ECF subfamily)
MRLIANELEPCSEPPLRDDDPLPPLDRLPRPRIALEMLYRDHAPRLLRFFSLRAGHVEAPDLVQEAFVRMAGTEPTVQLGIASPAAYLTRIATNLLRDRAKTAARRSTASHSSYDDGVHGGADPHRLLDDREALARLNVAVNRLNQRTRRIFLLHRAEGFTYAQIAAEMGMSIKGVKKQMAKALFELRRDVGPL